MNYRKLKNPERTFNAFTGNRIGYSIWNFWQFRFCFQVKSNAILLKWIGDLIEFTRIVHKISNYYFTKKVGIIFLCINFLCSSTTKRILHTSTDFLDICLGTSFSAVGTTIAIRSVLRRSLFQRNFKFREQKIVSEGHIKLIALMIIKSYDTFSSQKFAIVCSVQFFSTILRPCSYNLLKFRKIRYIMNSLNNNVYATFESFSNIWCFL